MDRYNAGYQITDHMHLEGSHFALGHNPDAPAPYAVWRTNEDLSEFQWGRYFAHKHAAIADMVLRSTYQLERPDGIPLSVDFLADNARESLQLQMISERAAENIMDQLADILLEYDTELCAEEIMQNPEFVEMAQNGYDNIDHSEENYALRQTLRDIFDEHPRFLCPAPVKTPLDNQIQAASIKQSHASEAHTQTPEIGR